MLEFAVRLDHPGAQRRGVVAAEADGVAGDEHRAFFAGQSAEVEVHARISFCSPTAKKGPSTILIVAPAGDGADLYR